MRCSALSGSLRTLFLFLMASVAITGNAQTPGRWIGSEYLTSRLLAGTEIDLSSAREVILPLELNVGRYSQVASNRDLRSRLLKISDTYEREVLPRLASRVIARGGRLIVQVTPFAAGLPFLEIAEMEDLEQAPAFAYSPTDFYRYLVPGPAERRVDYLKRRLADLPSEVELLVSFTYPRSPTLTASAATREAMIRATGVDPVDLGSALDSPSSADLNKLPVASREAILAVLEARGALIAESARQWVEVLGKRQLTLGMSASNASPSVIERAGVGLSEVDLAMSVRASRLAITIPDDSEASLSGLRRILAKGKTARELTLLLVDRKATSRIGALVKAWASQVKFRGTVNWFVLEKE